LYHVKGFVGTMKRAIWTFDAGRQSQQHKKV
jgi:hypothetical protein